MDIESNEVLIRGLSMPHSPRWYQGQLWVESGQGSLAVVGPERAPGGRWRRCRGSPTAWTSHGPLAFIGLSQVRETAVFSGIPLVERLRERTCGVWIVHIENGETVGFLRFEAGVQDIFAVQVLPGIRFPESVWTLLSAVPTVSGLTDQTTPWVPDMRLLPDDGRGGPAAVIGSPHSPEALAGMLNTWPIDDVPAPRPHRS